MPNSRKLRLRLCLYLRPLVKLGKGEENYINLSVYFYHLPFKRDMANQKYDKT